MDSKKTIAIVAVVIIVVAAIAVVVALTGSEDSNPTTHDYSGDLLVYGNANEDSVIDENDIGYEVTSFEGRPHVILCDSEEDLISFE